MKFLDCFVSVVVVVENRDFIGGTLRTLGAYLNKNFCDYEILLIDQGLKGDSLGEFEVLLKEIQSIRCLQLSYRVERDVALAAGMENAIGDFVILFTPSFDPLECIEKSVRKCWEGCDVVVGVANQPRTLGYRLIRPFSRFLLRGIGYELPNNATSFRCLTRAAVNIVTKTGKFHHQLYVRISKASRSSRSLHYQVVGSGRKRTLYDGLKQTLNLLVFNSTLPLRWMSGVGALGSFLAVCFAAYSMLIRLFRDDVIAGWTSLAFVMSFLFMLMFIILAFLGEYLGRLLDDRSERKDYAISGELNSSVMVNIDRLNVTDK